MSGMGTTVSGILQEWRAAGDMNFAHVEDEKESFVMWAIPA